MNKKLVVFVALVGVVMSAAYLYAEKLINERTVTKGYTGYAVDDKGEIIKFSNSVVDGRVERVTYIYAYGKLGSKQKEWSGNLLQGRDFESDITDFAIVSLAKKNVLALYTRADGTRYYASYKLKQNELKLQAVHEALTGEECWMHKNLIYSFTTSDGASTLLTYGLKFKLKKNKKINGIGIVRPVNPNIQKYYYDESGGPLGVDDVTVRIVKP